MSSWRDTASRQAQDDLDGLLNATLPFAQQMLDDQGEFFPFGATLDTEDQVSLVTGGPELGEQPASTDVLAVLAQGMRAGRGSLRATAIVSDVRLADTDAISVELEHREGSAVEVLLPYHPKRLLRGVDYGSITAQSGVRSIWA